VAALVIPYIVDKQYGDLGSKVFFVWGSTCATCVLFAYFFVPETKGLTLEQVDMMMAEVPPRKSGSWKPHDNFVHGFRKSELIEPATNGPDGPIKRID